MDAGCHVFMEKPIATNYEDAVRVVDKAREKNRKLVLGYILRHHPSWAKLVEIGRTLGKPLVMRMNLNQQSSGPAWNWHKNLMESLTPIVDCGVHYVDIMCQLTGAKPVRVHGIGAQLSAETKVQNYGHLHVVFDDGSVGWYEAGWGPMMSEVAYFVKDVVGPKGCVSILVPQEGQKDAGEGISDSADIDQHTKTNALKVHHAEIDGAEQFHAQGRVDQHGRRARPPGAVRPRAGVFPQGDPRGPRPDRLDERRGQLAAHRARRRREHPHPARGRALMPVTTGQSADRIT